MKRITHKLSDGTYWFSNGPEGLIKTINKAGSLEDWEDKLGIDLQMLSEVFDKGIYFVHERTGDILFSNHIDLTCYLEFKVYYEDWYVMLGPENYKLTWAFRKEDIESI